MEEGAERRARLGSYRRGEAAAWKEGSGALGRDLGAFQVGTGAAACRTWQRHRWAEEGKNGEEERRGRRREGGRLTSGARLQRESGRLVR